MAPTVGTDPVHATKLADARRVPYEDLFIYYLRGRVPHEALGREETFIGNWQEEDCSFLFFSQPADAQIVTMLAAWPDLQLIDQYQMTYENWQGDGLAPMQVGRLFIAPPWSDATPPRGSVPVWLDPGVVFGNGQHATTKNCLQALQQVILGDGPFRLLDLGTGSGVLALAAVALGCRRVLAVDLNFLAARTAWCNVVQNRVQRQVAVIQGKAEAFIDCPADLVVANIHIDVMLQLLDSPGFYRKRWFILSGLLGNHAKEVRERLGGTSSRIVQSWSEDGVWHTFLGKNDTTEQCRSGNTPFPAGKGNP